MNILSSLFGNRKTVRPHRSSTAPRLDLDSLLHALDHYIEAYEDYHGLKPERILVKSDIHKVFVQADIYSSRRFGDILIIPATTIKGNRNWQAI